MFGFSSIETLHAPNPIFLQEPMFSDSLAQPPRCRLQSVGGPDLPSAAKLNRDEKGESLQGAFWEECTSEGSPFMLLFGGLYRSAIESLRHSFVSPERK